MERRAYRVELMMRIFWLALCFCLPALQSAMAGAPDVTVPADTVKCDLKGWSTDRSAQGLSVLAAPNASASVITHYLHGAIANYQVDFSIKGFKDGFLLIGISCRRFCRRQSGRPLHGAFGSQRLQTFRKKARSGLDRQGAFLCRRLGRGGHQQGHRLAAGHVQRPHGRVFALAGCRKVWCGFRRKSGEDKGLENDDES